MNTVTATYFRRHVNDVLETAQTQPVCITRYGKPQWVIVSEARYNKLVNMNQDAVDKVKEL